MDLNFLGKNVKCVDLVFENCEVLRVFAQDIKGFAVKGITTNLYFGGKSVSEEYDCESFSVCIARLVMDSMTDFTHRTWRSRMSCDVTWFEIYFDDDSYLKFIAPWPFDIMGNEQWAPKNQTYYFDEDDDFVFFASKNVEEVETMRKYGKDIETGRLDRTTEDSLAIEDDDDFIPADSNGGYSTEDFCKNVEKINKAHREVILSLNEAEVLKGLLEKLGLK